MARPTLWLALATIVLATTVVILLVLLVLGVFQQNLVTVTVQEMLDAASTSPWSTFIPSGNCQIYPGFTHTGDPSPPGPTGASLNCTPLNDVAAILTTRKCLKQGCLDLTNIPRAIGYVETAYQDCSKAFSCSASDAVCYVPQPSCEDLGQSLVQVKTNDLCLTRPVDVATSGTLTASNCVGVQRNQQFNFLPTTPITLGQPYAVTVPGTANCVLGPSVVSGVNVTAQLNPCSSNTKGAFIITPEYNLEVPYSVGASTYRYPAIRPSQLLWLANTDNAPKAIPIDFTALRSFSQTNLSLQGAELKPFIAACTNLPSTIPPQLVGQVVACPVNSFLPSATV